MIDKPNKIFTLLFIHQHDRILLGMKKRGFGHGKYNGFGGKVEKSETISQAAIREMYEESGIKPINPQLQGYICCEYTCEPKIFKVFIYRASDYEGEPLESEEMKPEWVKTDEIPFQSMWADDPYWLPLMLKGEFFRGILHFEGYEKLVNADVQIIGPEQVHQEMLKEDLINHTDT